MAFEIIEGISRADIAYRVSGKDPVELFTTGAEALISIMLKDHETVLRNTTVAFTCDASGLDLLYFDFLSEFIYFKDSEKLLLLPERVEITQTENGFSLSCSATGESIDRERHLFTVDIKAVTMHNLSVTRDASGYAATVVVDV